MNVGQFQAVLVVAEKMHRELGDEEAAKAIACFSNLLKGRKTEKVSDFVRRIEDARSLKRERGT